MSGRVDSYDREAVRPQAGTLWVWEPESAPALLRVTRVLWNGEQWWVEAESLADYGPFRPRSDVSWNDLSRFWEAVRAVAVGPGPPRGRQATTRCGVPQPDEMEEAS